MNLLRFTLYYILYSAILGITACLLPVFFPNIIWLANKFWVVFGFLAGITFIAYTVADLGIKHSPDAGIMAIMGSIAVKMIFSMAFVLIYSAKGVENAMIFMINFFSLYLLFSLFEIYCLMRNLRHQNK